MYRMNFVEHQLSTHFVSVAWVAHWYQVSRMTVHRAIESGKLPAVRIAGPPEGRGLWILDRRTLPEEFPK